MTANLPGGDRAEINWAGRTLAAEEILPLLQRYHLLPQLLREMLIDEAIAPITYTPEERALFEEQRRFTPIEGLTPEQREDAIARQLKIEKFQQATWGEQLEAYFLQRKRSLDRYVCSLIRVEEAGTAQELYYRLQLNEQPFFELARDYSRGSEARQGGIIGPVTLDFFHRAIAQKLAVSQPGQLWPPARVDEWIVIVRLEELIPAQLDRAMQQRLLQELLETWLQAQIARIPPIQPSLTPKAA